MEWAKNTLVNQFIFSFASSASLVSQKMQLDYDGLPEDYLEKYPQRLAAITLEGPGPRRGEASPSRKRLCWS